MIVEYDAIIMRVLFLEPETLLSSLNAKTRKGKFFKK
jgi:hypothetical protein